VLDPGDPALSTTPDPTANGTPAPAGAPAAPAEATHRPVVLVSNRGPLTFRVADDGTLEPRRGAGGLVSGLGPLIEGTDAMWIAAAMTEGDRRAAERGVIDADGFRVRTLALDPERYRMAYDVVCNATLWFVHHHLFDLSRRPRIDMNWRRAWDAYVEVNHAFAEVVVAEAPRDATVLIQDYHLCLLAPTIRERRPDLRTVHFAHTPFAGPDGLRVLPDDVAVQLLEAMAAHDACGFHTARWAAAFERSCCEIIGTKPHTFVSPLASDPDDLRWVAGGGACARELVHINELLGDRAFIARVDRIELSKNLVRGFYAYDDLLERYPQWRERVVFGAFVYPSREGLPEYLAYRNEVEALVARLNEKWSTDTWTPIIFDASDNFPRSVAALRRYDALLVNPIRDGLNLVAKEGALLNEHDGVLLLSPEAGAHAEMGDEALTVNPFDISGTADALDRALSMPAAERSAHAEATRAVAAARTPKDWLDEQLAAALVR
jgi:trehalose 6-phosphate synthase